MIELDLKEMLPTIRKAFDAGKLQMQNVKSDDAQGMACLYSGPCAIGVCLEPEQQAFLDSQSNENGSDIGQLIEDKHIHVHPDQGEDLCDLQERHDGVVSAIAYHGIDSSEQFEAFETLLKRLEAKYL